MQWRPKHNIKYNSRTSKYETKRKRGHGNCNKGKRRPVHRKSRTSQWANRDNAHQNQNTRTDINNNNPLSRPRHEHRGRNTERILGRIKQIPNRIKKKDIVIGATDNNDQVRRNTEHENKTIGNGPHPKKIANRKGETS